MASTEAVLLTGTIGVGKTVVATEMCEVLAGRHVPAAIIDLDWLGWVSMPPPRGVDGLIATNLGSVWPNFRAAGIDRFILTRTVTEAGQIDVLRNTLSGTKLHVVRLQASIPAIAGRLRRRDTGPNLERHLEESEKLMEAAPGTEDFAVANENRPIREVALEILERLGWG